MATYGLGNFKYDITVNGTSANFKFFDPEDVTNTAEVSLHEKDFPEGITEPDTREVAEVALAQCQKLLNDKRDARIKKEREAELDEQSEETKRSREAANDFLANTQEGGGTNGAPKSDAKPAKKGK